MEKPRLENVYNFTNGMTAAFDQFGKHMPEYQGRTDEVMPKIYAAGYSKPVPTVFWHKH